MKHRSIPLSTIDIPPEALDYIKEIFRSKRLTYGKFTQTFEIKFAALHGNRYGVMVNSGTSALQIALHAAKIFHHWQSGDEVILPALTFVADVNVIAQNNLRPVFVDVHPDYFNLDPTKIEGAIGHKTRAIIVPHLFGQPADMAAIQIIAKRHRLTIIEDACHAPFAEDQGHTVGFWGEITCFSTYAAHIFSTGVGGLAVTRHARLASLLRSLAFHGRDPAYHRLEDDDDPVSLTRIIQKRFLFPYRGYSYRITEMEAALGFAQFTTYRRALRIRQQNAQYLIQKLAPLEHIFQLPRVRIDTSHVFMVFPLIIKNPTIGRDELLLFLERKGIETRYLLPLVSQPCYRDLHIDPDDFPVAKNLSRRGFYIGCHHGLSKKDLDYIVEQFFAFAKTV